MILKSQLYRECFYPESYFIFSLVQPEAKVNVKQLRGEVICHQPRAQRGNKRASPWARQEAGTSERPVETGARSQWAPEPRGGWTLRIQDAPTLLGRSRVMLAVRTLRKKFPRPIENSNSVGQMLHCFHAALIWFSFCLFLKLHIFLLPQHPINSL